MTECKQRLMQNNAARPYKEGTDIMRIIMRNPFSSLHFKNVGTKKTEKALDQMDTQ